MGNATRHALRSRDHGPEHWRDVTRTGLMLCQKAKADPVVVFLFGAFHDTQRRSDHRDPQHGPRAATLVNRLVGSGELDLTERQSTLLQYALFWHDAGRTHHNPTIGACWDADRLMLIRVGMRVNPALLCTRWAQENPGSGWRIRDARDMRWRTIARLAAA